MRLDRRFAIVVGLSLIWAFLVSAVFYRVAARSARQQRPAPQEKPVVVAVGILELGAVIKPGSVRLSRMPETLFPKGGFSRAEDVIERPVISPIQPDEPIVEARLAPRGSGTGVAPLIPSGMRAMSVRVNDVVGVAGFILPGMRVDVLVTGRPPGREESVTRTVLQNIAVLSAGQVVQVDAGKQSINAAVVTLLVTPVQAEALALANSEGRIQLVLRNSSDQQLAQTLGRRLGELFGFAPAAPRDEASRSKPVPVAVVTPAAVTTPAVVDLPADRILMIRGNIKSFELPDGPEGRK